MSGPRWTGETAVVSLPPLPQPQQGEPFDTSGLRVFTSIPAHHHDVVALHGMVVVYETDWREIRHGDFYVIESQRPVAGMSWEVHDRINREYGQLGPRSRLETTREVVRARRCHRDDDAWWLDLSSGFSDGPFKDCYVGHSIVGRVVGIYHPSAPRPAD